MLKRINSFANSFTSWWTIAGLVSGLVVSVGVPVWAARTTHFIQEYAPLSWVMAAFAGAVAFALIAALIAWARLKFVQASAVKRYHQEGDRLNPLDVMFTSRRIRIQDLVSPISRIIEGKTFIDCEIIGPAMVGLSATAPGKAGFNSCGFSNSAGAVVKNNAFVPYGTMIKDCNFLRCKIDGLLLLIPEDGADYIKNSMPGLPWITPDQVSGVVPDGA